MGIKKKKIQEKRTHALAPKEKEENDGVRFQ
jgi:hypothetical protein